MKNVFILAVLFAFSVAAQAQTSATTTPVTPAKELIQVKESYDFGKIPQGRPATYVVEVTNIGTEPLKLDDVQASCGCTTPQWSKDAIAPGATSKIVVGYNAYAEGYFEKTITLKYNQGQSKVIVIKGTVYKAPPAPAPENASVKLLKQAANQ